MPCPVIRLCSYYMFHPILITGKVKSSFPTHPKITGVGLRCGDHLIISLHTYICGFKEENNV